MEILSFTKTLSVSPLIIKSSYLKGRRIQQRVHWLGYVGCMEVVVIWDVLQVVVLQG